MKEVGDLCTKRTNFYSEVQIGIDLLWNNNFNEAEDYFGKNKDFHPRYALHWAEVPVLKSWITESEKERKDAIDRLLMVVQIAEEHIKQYDRGVCPISDTLSENEFQTHKLDTKIVLGDAYTLLAAFLVMDEQKIKAALNLRRGWKVYEAALQDLDTLKIQFDHDVVSTLKFGAGLFFFVLSLVPPGIASKAASFIGFKANKELGLNYLRQSYMSCSLRAHFAGIVLALNHVLLTPSLDAEQHTHLTKEAEEIIEHCLTIYSKGSFFQLIAGLYGIELFQLDRAILHLETAAENCQSVIAVPPIILRVLSNCYTMKFDWQTAADVLERIVFQEFSVGNSQIPIPALVNTTIKLDTRSAWHILKLATCYHKVGEHTKASLMLQWILQADKAKEKWVTIVERQTKRYTRNGLHFAIYEVMYLTGQFDKILLRAADTSDAPSNLLKQIKEASAYARGAKQKVTETYINELVPKKKSTGMLGWFTLGYYSPPSLCEEDIVVLENRATYLLLKSVIKAHIAKRADPTVRDKLSKSVAKDLSEILLMGSYLDKLYQVLALTEFGKFYGREQPEKAVKYFEDAIKISGYDWDDTMKLKLRSYISSLSNKEVFVEDDQEAREEK